MTEREQMVQELIDELGGLLNKDEALVVMLDQDGKVISSILDSFYAGYTVRNLASRIKSEEEKKNED